MTKRVFCVYDLFMYLPKSSISLATKASQEPGLSRSIVTRDLDTVRPIDPFESLPRAYTTNQNTWSFWYSFFITFKNTHNSFVIFSVKSMQIKMHTSFKDGMSNTDNDAGNESHMDSSSSSLTCCDLGSAFCLPDLSSEFLHRL